MKTETDVWDLLEETDAELDDAVEVGDRTQEMYWLGRKRALQEVLGMRYEEE